MKKIRLILSRIIPCLIIVLCIAMVASCKGCKNNNNSSYKYPSVTPKITDPSGTYINIDGYKVTNENVYNRLIQSYGLTAIQDWMDEIILKDVAYDSNYSNEDFQNNLSQIIYGVDENDSTKSKYDALTEEERIEAKAAFEKKMRNLGYFTEEEYTAYYLLEYKRMNFAVKAYKEFVNTYDADEANKEDYFTEAKYKEYFESVNHADVDAIIVTFDSELQAKKIMEKYGVDLSKDLNGAWVINGETATTATLTQLFVNMYNDVNVTDITTAKHYDYKALTTISSVIASKVYGLSTANDDLNKSYTHGPQVYGNRFYLVLKTNQTALETTFEQAYADATKKADMFHHMVENSMTSDYMSKVLFEERNKHNLKIYDEGIEVKYVASYNAAYKALSITDYTAYATTTEENATNVASFEINGKTETLTAQNLFNDLSGQYGGILSLLLLQQYTVLNNSDYNKVFNYVTGEIKDQTTYDSYYKTDVQDYKDKFNEGTYAENGYPTAYGWNNFLRDYLGVLDEKELLTNLDGSLFTAAQDILKRTLWIDKSVETDPETNVESTVEVDTRVQAEMEKIFNEFFSATIIGVNAYYDEDLDGKTDAFDVNKDGTKAIELVNLIYSESAKLTKDTLSERLANTVILYKLATNEDPVWGQYKQLGLRVAAIGSTSYTNSSSINDILAGKVKDLWNKVYNYDSLKNEEGKIIGATITGQTLDPGYRYTANSQAHFVSSESAVLRVDAFTCDTTNTEGADHNSAYLIFVTKAVAPTFISSSSKTYKPTLANYDAYKKDSTAVGTATATAIKTYYEVAIANLLTIDGNANAVLTNAVYENCTALLAKTTWGTNTTAASQITKLITDLTVVEK